MPEIIMFWCMPVTVYYLTVFFVHQPNDHKDNKRNTVDEHQVFWRVLQINALTTFSLFVATFLYEIYGFRWWDFILGIVLIDTVEYWAHRAYHHFPILYQYLHKEHHRLYRPWAMAAMYNSFAEGITTGALMTFVFMDLFRYSVFSYCMVLSFSHCKTVLDHVYTSGENSHHWVHHNNGQVNFQQPFFDYWDRLMHTKSS